METGRTIKRATHDNTVDKIAIGLQSWKDCIKVQVFKFVEKFFIANRQKPRCNSPLARKVDSLVEPITSTNLPSLRLVVYSKLVKAVVRFFGLKRKTLRPQSCPKHTQQPTKSLPSGSFTTNVQNSDITNLLFPWDWECHQTKIVQLSKRWVQFKKNIFKLINALVGCTPFYKEVEIYKKAEIILEIKMTNDTTELIKRDRWNPG